ncbi:HTH domain resolvase [Vibrio phage 1.110.O._10N.261.52.C1]|nr:HTH domain resolvase [Vibrio phage 1.110.O._10N.261.52.C1]
MTAGRPTKYKEELCKRSVAFLSKGKSVTQLSAHLDVSKSTIYKWAEDHKEYSDALTRGRELSQAHWEGELVDMMYNKEVNSPLVKLYFANRFGWSDKVESKNENANVEKVKSFSEMYGNSST